jgi:hypothetical protein
MRVKARLQLGELAEFFEPAIASRIATEIWGKNTTIILGAINGKHYWVSYKFKDFNRRYIATRIAKPSKTNPGCFQL